MKRILILPLYGIGDVLMTTPALRNLKEQRDVEVTYLHMFETTRDILLNNPHIEENVFFPFLRRSRLEGLRFLMQFRRKFDCSINFYPSNRRDYNLAAFIVGSRVRLGHRYRLDDIRELNFLKTETIRENDDRHCVEENLKLLDFFNVKDKIAYPLEIYLTEEERLFSEEWMKARNINAGAIVGIHPGTSVFKNHDKRRWPEAAFAEVIIRLSKELRQAVFLLFGGPEEKPLRDEIVSLVSKWGRVFSVDEMGVRRAASLMRHCKIFISNDSGPMHMAAASGVPTVAIFGPTNPAWVRPWAVRHRVVRSGIPCSPCFRYSRRPLRCASGMEFACLSKISSGEVIEACRDLLGEVSG